MTELVDRTKGSLTGAYVAIVAMLVVPNFFLVHPYMHLLIMAPLLVWTGCQRSLLMAQMSPEESQVETVSKKDAMRFPLIGSAVLFSLYVVVKLVKKEYLDVLISCYFAVHSAAAAAASASPDLDPDPSLNADPHPHPHQPPGARRFRHVRLHPGSGDGAARYGRSQAVLGALQLPVLAEAGGARRVMRAARALRAHCTAPTLPAHAAGALHAYCTAPTACACMCTGQAEELYLRSY